MSNSINTNVSAQVALQTLNATNQSLASTQNRISTGLKINDAKDDSAVWSIAQTMRSQNSALDSVTASLNRGVSTLNVANTAGTAISDLLTQMQSAVLAASDKSLDSTSRASYQQKYSSLAQQIGTYIKNAAFNGVNMLDGSTASFSALANADGTNTIVAQGENLKLATGSSGGAAATPSINAAAGAAASPTGVATLSQTSTFTVQEGSTNFTVSLPPGGYTATQLAQAINTASAAAGGSASVAGTTGGDLTLAGTAGTPVTLAAASGDLGTNTALKSLTGLTSLGPLTAATTAAAVPATPAGVSGAGLSQASSFTLTSDQGTSFTVSLAAGYYSSANLASAINNAYSAAGLAGTAATVGSNGNLQLTGVSGPTGTAVGTGDLTAAGAPQQLLGGAYTTVQSYVAATAFSETGGGGVILISGNENFSANTNYADLITKLKTSIANVSSAMGSLGAANNAMTNHLTFVSKLQDSLTTGIGNLVDADVAKESANLTALQTKQQLGVQALSIANQAPQTILALFKS